MPRYRVGHDYHYRMWQLLAGEVVELDREAHELISQHASSALILVPDDTPLVSAEELDAAVAAGDDQLVAEAVAEEAETGRALETPPHDRMQGRGRARERRHLDKASDPESGSTGPITKAGGFGAMKGA